MEIEIMAEGLTFPEAPVVCDDGSVILGELRGQRITRIRADGTKQHIADIDGAPNGLAVGPDGALYCCNNGGFLWPEPGSPPPIMPIGTPPSYRSGSIDRIDMATGKVERLYDSCDGIPLAGPNDIVFDAQGGFWFSDLGKEVGRSENPGGLFYARTDGSRIRRVVDNIGLNGVGLSPDGKTVYAAPTWLRWIIVVPADPDLVIAQGVHQTAIVTSFPGRRFLDSMAIEADGTIAQAVLFEDPAIARVNPDTGAIANVAMPDVMPTNIAFGGPDMRTAYVTLTAEGRLARMRWPAPGLRLPFNI